METPMNMFCHQCQEAKKNSGCDGQVGVCGKTAPVSNLQDLLVYTLKGIAFYNQQARKSEINLKETDQIIMDGLFTTITNANFDDEAIKDRIGKALSHRDAIKIMLKEAGKLETGEEKNFATWITSRDEFEVFASQKSIGILRDDNEDVRSLRSLVLFGLKGIAAYGEHAWNLGKHNPEISVFIENALLATENDSLSADELTALVLETGKYGVDVMALLDEAHTSSYGHPELSEVEIGVRNNPAILVSGHDLKDFEELLEQSEGSGVDIYTHSEMLPANYYPAFKKYSHFVGNYGNAWWKQKEEFESFHGLCFSQQIVLSLLKPATVIVFTQQALQDIRDLSMSPEELRVERKTLVKSLNTQKKLPSPTGIEEGKIVGGFAHNQVIALADKVVDAVKSGAIKQFFVMAGCDGRMKSRDYYTDFAEALPKDTVILTAGCAKYRYNKLDLGDIGGIPRVLDAGQCNDSYSLAVIALKLKEVFELNDINELPISYNIAWYEQKAVIVLLALLHLGVKNIKLGPTLPAFLSPNVAKVLVENFGINGIQSVEEDMEQFMG